MSLKLDRNLPPLCKLSTPSKNVLKVLHVIFSPQTYHCFMLLFFIVSYFWSVRALMYCLRSHQSPSIGLSSQWYFGQNIIFIPYFLASISSFEQQLNAGWSFTSSLISFNFIRGRKLNPSSVAIWPKPFVFPSRP